MQRLLSIKDLAINPETGEPGLLGLAESTLWRWVSLGKFPQPALRTGRVTRWRASDIEAWIEREASKQTRRRKHPQRPRNRGRFSCDGDAGRGGEDSTPTAEELHQLIE